MFADRTGLSGHPPASPQKLHTVACTAFGTNAFGRFFAQANGLDTFNSLFGIAATLFCFHSHFSTFKGWDEGLLSPTLADMQKSSN